VTARLPPTTPEELTASPLLARNTALNLLGQGLPLLVAVVAIPVLIGGIGVDRFGLLALAWLVIGYFGLFDLGIGRALTQFVSERLGQGDPEEVSGVAWTGLLAMAALGVLAWLGIHLLSPWLVTRVLNVPAELQEEAVGAFRILALALPFVVSAAGLRGLLEALQRFGFVNGVRVPLGALTFLGPLAVLPFSTDLRPIVGALVAARVLGWAAYGVLLLRAMPALRIRRRLERSLVAPLLRFGGWITVSNVVSPLMVHLDRIVIGAVLSMAAVAYYATPFEVVTRLWIVPVAIVGVLFPAFATSFTGDRERTVKLFLRGSQAILILVFPLVLLVIGLAGPGLEAWVGADFAREGTAVAQWLALGIFVNSMAHVPYSLLQATGRPDVTAKLHLAEAPFYFLLLWGLLATMGLTGAAIAWAIRVIVDAVLLFGFTVYLIPACRKATVQIGAWTSGALGLLALALIPVEGMLARGLLMAGVLMLFGIFAWYGILDADQKSRVRGRLREGCRPPLLPVSVALLLASGVSVGTTPLEAQDGSSDSAIRAVPSHITGLRGEEARYLRLLQMQDRAPITPWGLRGFGPRLRDQMVPRAGNDHPWIERTHARMAFDHRLLSLVLHPVEARTFYQSAFPLQWQDGPSWAGRGISTDLTMGAELRSGPLTLRLAPTAWFAANQSFALMEHSQSESLPFADPRQPRNIDFPQRFGDGSVSRVDLGDSEARLDVLGLAAGISTAPIGWGPGEVFSMILSGRGPGFAHGFLGAGRPLDLRAFELQFRGAWGELEQSDFAPWEELEARRFASSLAITISPSPLPGLELGFGRFFHVPWREGGPRLDDYLRPLEGILKRDRFIDDPDIGRDGPGIETRDNQLASAWARWVFPGAGLEFYGEFARNDHPWDFRDLFVELDQNSGWMLGGAWAFDGEGGTWLLRAETANARINHLGDIRLPQHMFYRHDRSRQGHTHRGQPLGTPAIYGGGGSYIGVDRYDPDGRFGVRWRRELRNDRFTPPGGFEDISRTHDVIHALTLDAVRFRGDLEFGGELTGALNLNRYFDDDAFNLRLVVGARARF
jgi:O-antigen/teichoic acid export membrane protein